MKIEKDEILKAIENNWPTHVSEIIDKLKIAPDTEEDMRQVTEIIRNNIKELSNEKKIIVENIGSSMVAWPTEIKTLKEKNKILS